MTTTIKDRTALILAPHADDETLGCGGTIALKRQSETDVFVAIVTDGSASHRRERTVGTTVPQLIALRQAEARTACQILGVDAENLSFLGFKDGKLSDQIADISASILTLIDTYQPDEIYVCAYQDGHPDHVALAKAARLAALSLPGTEFDFFEYPIWTFDFRSWRVLGKTNKASFFLGLRKMSKAAAVWKMRSVSIAPVLEIKTRALAAHRSQLGTHRAEPHWSGLPLAFQRHFLTSIEIFRQIPRGDNTLE